MEKTDSPIEPGTPVTPAAMAGETDLLQQKLLKLRKLQSTGRTQMLFTALVIILMFSVFMSATYFRIQKNFDQSAVQQAVSERGAQVLPLATKLLIESGRSSMPAYREALTQTLHDRGPELASAAVARFEQVPEENGKVLQERLQETFAKALSRIEPRFKQEFPGLADERRQAMLQDFTMKQIDAQNKQVASRVSQLYTNDLSHMQVVLDKFKLPDTSSPQDREDTEKNFMHTMVMLLDDQVDSAYSKPEVDDHKGPRPLHAAVALPATQPAKAQVPQADAQ